MNHSLPSGVTTKRLPLWVYLVPGGIAAALVATFVFGVPLKTVGTWAVFIAFFGLHFLMHGAHGGHSQHSDQTGTAAPAGSQTVIDGPPSLDEESDQHESRHRCC